MKKLFITLIVIYTHFLVIGQLPDELKYSCTICEGTECMDEMDTQDCSHTSPLWNSNDLFIPGSNFEDINVRVNFIFLHKADGSGMFIEGNEEHDLLIEDIIEKVNYTFSNLVNPTDPDCHIPVGFLSTSKIQIVPNIVHINDEYGWNNESDVYPYCPSPPWYLDYLDEQIDNDPTIPKGVNVYFTETSWYYDALIVNQTTEDEGPINNACSQFPSTYDLDRTSRIHMPNLFTKYWWMKHIAPEIYNEPWDPVIRGWFVSIGTLLAHELGHSYWLPHDNSCEWNIMHQHPDFGRKHFFLNQIGKMHRCLSVTNVRKFSTEESYISTPYQVEENTLWDLNFTMYRDVIVKPNKTLTVTCNLVMKNEAKIIIEQGAVLVLDGGTITTEDNTLWQGIEVWGDKYDHQYTIEGQNAQGQLILKNGATIENAICAVELWRPGYYGTMGGIVKASDATFRNNAKSIHALHYSNFHPYIPEQETDNVCYFKNCTFEINEDYIPSHTFYKHIDLASVKGIGFTACDFVLADVPGVSPWNHGIAAYSAGFSVTAQCLSTMIPCNEYDKCTFTGFNNGIYSSNTVNLNTFYVNRAEFHNNSCGIKANNVDNFGVLFSEFYVGHNSSDGQKCESEGKSAAGFGISSINSTGFAIEENEFYKTAGAPSGNYVGIHIAETGNTDQVYKNKFDGLSYGNYTEGKNWLSNNTFQGLAFFCNENTNNYADFYVESDPNNPSGIQSKQGDEEHVTGNQFSATGATWHFYNGGDFLVGYYFCEYCDNENPDDSKIYNVTDKGKNFHNPCPSHYGGSGHDPRGLVLSDEQKLETEMLYAANLTSYNNIEALYRDLKDGGNTEALTSEVETSWPQDMWELRAELLGKSPHLSLDVLKKVADKTEVLPESILFEILAANPDELKKEELLKYLEDKENPLPGYMIDILRQVAEGTTYKTVLEQRMAHYNQVKTRAAYDMIRSYVNDSILDLNGLRNWLDNIGGVRADEQIIATFMQEENYSDAFALANMMPQFYDYDQLALTEHNYYMDILNLNIKLKQEKRTILELTTAEVDNLKLIAENSRGTAGSQAKGILETNYGFHFCDCLNTLGTEGFKSGNVNGASYEEVYGAELSVNPNPAREWTAFNYTLPDNVSEGVIKISDISGKVIDSFFVSGLQGQKIWDTRNIQSGVYFYIFTANGNSKAGKIVISK